VLLLKYERCHINKFDLIRFDYICIRLFCKKISTKVDSFNHFSLVSWLDQTRRQKLQIKFLLPSVAISMSLFYLIKN